MKPANNQTQSSPNTISEAVSAFTDAFVSSDPEANLAALSQVKIDKFVGKENLPAFIHLLCNSTLLGQARYNNINFEMLIEAAIPLYHETHWQIPASLALIELRYANDTLANISEVEKDAIQSFYELDRLQDQCHFKYYRSGTTSIIFISGSTAIKIVRPVYLMDREVASLDKYQQEYFDAPLAPIVHWAKPAVLAMDWIKGETLEEKIQQGLQDFTLEDRLSTIRALGAVIGTIHGKSVPHGDLNPRNIILEQNSGTGKSLRLIDYGVNYSLTKPVLSAQSYRDSVRYIAPTSGNARRDPYLDDLYSLSVIILDVWFGDINKPAEELLHELSIIQPLLAFVLEDALVENANLRLLKFSSISDDHCTRAKKLSSAIQVSCSEINQSAMVADEKTSLIALISGSPFGILTFNNDSDSTTVSLDANINKRLNVFKKLSVWVTTVSTSALFAVAAASYSNSIGVFSELRSWWYSIGYAFTQPDAEFWEILPGLAICLSFLLLATKYYLAIFSSTAPKVDVGFGSKSANLTMRLNAFAYVIPIAYCFLLDPKAWPFCAAIGLSIVALNNVMTFRMLQNIRNFRTFKQLALSRSAEANTTYTVFAGWGELVSWYAIGVAFAGLILVTSESAKNNFIDQFTDISVSYNVYEYLFALSVIGINYFKMQRENCGRLAPRMRALIQRYIEAAKVYGKQNEQR